MSAIQDGRRKLSNNELFDCLNDRRRRQLLRLLADTSESMTERELAERLLVDEKDRSIEDVAEVTIEGVQIQLQHVHLPRLDEADFVDWHQSDGTVDPTEDPVYEDAEFQHLIELDDDEWDAVASTMRDGRLRNVLSVLAASDDGVRRDVLAHKIAAHEADGESWAEAVENVRTELHHVHLPKLDGAGVVEYDVDSGTVTYQGHPADDGWER